MKFHHEMIAKQKDDEVKSKEVKIKKEIIEFNKKKQSN
jgi:hypothetical protein